jgi:hypothetical protein
MPAMWGYALRHEAAPDQVQRNNYGDTCKSKPVLATRKEARKQGEQDGKEHAGSSGAGDPQRSAEDSRSLQIGAWALSDRGGSAIDASGDQGAAEERARARGCRARPVP